MKTSTSEGDARKGHGQAKNQDQKARAKETHLMMLRPLRKLIRITLKLPRQLIRRRRILQKQNRAVRGRKTVKTPLTTSFLRGIAVQVRLDGLPDEGPELVVVGAEEDDEAAGLAVEGGRDGDDGVGDQGFEARVGDGGGLLEGVVGAAVFECFEEGG